MTKKIYCGTKEPNKNQKRGTMQECAEMGQVRYWGLSKIDKRLLEFVEAEKKVTKNVEKAKQEALIKMATISGKLNRMKKNLPYEKDKQKKEDLQKEIQKLQIELNKARSEIKKIEEMKDQMIKAQNKNIKKDIKESIDISNKNKQESKKVKNKIERSKKSIKNKEIMSMMDKTLDSIIPNITEQFKNDDESVRLYRSLMISHDQIMSLNPDDKKEIDNNIIKNIKSNQKKDKQIEKKIKSDLNKIKKEKQKLSKKEGITKADLNKIDNIIKNLDNHIKNDNKRDKDTQKLINEINQDNKKIIDLVKKKEEMAKKAIQAETKAIKKPKKKSTSKKSVPTKSLSQAQKQKSTVNFLKNKFRKISDLLDQLMKDLGLNPELLLEELVEDEEYEDSGLENWQIYGEIELPLQEDEYDFWSGIASDADQLSFADNKDSIMYILNNIYPKLLEEVYGTNKDSLQYFTSLLSDGDKLSDKQTRIINSLRKEMNIKVADIKQNL